MHSSIKSMSEKDKITRGLNSVPQLLPSWWSTIKSRIYVSSIPLPVIWLRKNFLIAINVCEKLYILFMSLLFKLYVFSRSPKSLWNFHFHFGKLKMKGFIRNFFLFICWVWKENVMKWFLMKERMSVNLLVWQMKKVKQ